MTCVTPLTCDSFNSLHCVPRPIRWSYISLQSLQNRLAMAKVAVKITVAPTNAGVSPEELLSALRGVINRTKERLGKVSRAPIPCLNNSSATWGRLLYRSMSCSMSLGGPLGYLVDNIKSCSNNSLASSLILQAGCQLESSVVIRRLRTVCFTSCC